MRTLFGLLLVGLAFPCLAQDIFTSPKPDEVFFGPFSVTQNVSGVTVAVPVSAFLKGKVTGDTMAVRVRVLADLADLQTKIGSVIDAAAPMPTNVCDHFGVDNVVARVWGKQLTVSGAEATLKLSGDAEVWTCIQDPVPCTRCDMVLKDGPFGSKFEVPECRAYSCNPPIETRNLTQPFDGWLPFTLVVADPKAVAVKLGDPRINLGGLLGGVTAGILKIAGVDVNARAKAALEQAISPALLRQSIPQEILALDPTITSAALVDNSGRLAAQIELSAMVYTAQMGELLKKIAHQPTEK